MMDSYLGDELLVETNHEVLRHLENCPPCRTELAARRGLLSQMRSAVKDAPEMRLNPTFALKLRKDLRQTALRPSVWEKLKNGFVVNQPIFAATITACLLFGIFFGAIWLRRPSTPENIIAQQNQANKAAEFSRPSESPVIQAVQIAWQETMHAAIGDHENCALHYRLPEEPITLEEAAEKYGRFNKDLDKAVIASLKRVTYDEKVSSKTPRKLEFLDAHSCVYNGRRFTHIELQSGDKIISILVTDVEDSFDENDGTTTNQAVENFRVVGFRAARHAVFVVSDLTEQENLTIAKTLFPAIRRHIEQAEA